MEVAFAEVGHRNDPGIFGVDPTNRLLARRFPRLLLVGFSLAVVALLRLYVAVNPIGNLNADEAVSGLMARHILEGEFPVFYWGQTYGGTAEVFLTAALFWVTDSSTFVLKSVPFVLYAAAAFITWRIGKRVFGEPGATFAGLLLLVWPPFLVWKSIQAHGYYGFLLIMGTAALLVAFQIADSPTKTRFAALGMLFGLGWWTSPQMALVAIPIVLWLVVFGNTRRPSGFALLIVGTIIGSMPWWMWNAANGWASITDQIDLPDTTYWGRLWGLFEWVLPLGLGLRLSNSDRWVLPAWGGWVFYGAVLAAFLWFVVWAIRTRNGALILLAAILMTFPWIYALSPHTWYLDEPRYLTLIFPAMCLILGWSFNRSFLVTLLGLMLTLPLTVVGLRVMNGPDEVVPFSDEPRASGLTSVIETLERHDARYVIADYWIAYPISFETRETIIATSSGFVRYGPHDALVRSQPDPAYVFVTGAPDQQAFQSELETAHPGYAAIFTGEYTVYLVP